MPQQIPIIYTGREAAAPDFKTMGANIRESFRRVSENQRNKQRYEDLKAERQRRELLDELDPIEVSSTNQWVQDQNAKLYDEAVNEVSGLLKERDGDLDVNDYVHVKKIMNNYSQQMSTLTKSEKQRERDIATVTDPKNINKFDPELIKNELYGWDYETQGIYKSNLESLLREVGEDELINKDKQDLKNADYVATFVGSEGDNRTTVEQKYMTKFYTPTADGQYDLNEDQAIDFIYQKYQLPDRQQDYASLLRKFDELPDVEEQSYINRYGEDKAPFAWYTLKNSDELFPISKKVKVAPLPKSEREDGVAKDKRTVVDVTSGQGQFGDKSIVSSGTKTYFNKEGEKKTGTFRRGDLVYTDIEWSENPETGDSEWMVKGYIPKAGEIEIPEDASESELVRAILQASAIKGDRAVEEVRIPYESIKEEMDRNYRLKGIDDFEPPTTTYIYDGAEFSQDEIKQAADALNMSVDAYVKKYKIKTK